MSMSREKRKSISTFLKSEGFSYAQIGRLFTARGQDIVQSVMGENHAKMAKGVCELCGKSSDHLHRHHLDYVKGTIEMLCGSCHARVHQADKPIPDHLNDFAKMLKNWRKQRGFMQKEAASFLSVSRRTYEGWEYGKTVPKELAMAEILRRMSK